MTRNRILGAVGVLWAMGPLFSALLGGHQVARNGAYAAGQTTGLIFSCVLGVVGLYYLIKG